MEKVEKLLKTEPDSESVYGDNDKYIKTKIKIHADSINKNFHGKKMPKEKVPCRFSSIIAILKHFWTNVNMNKKR